ncbi:MAG: hypothetical protein IJ275_06205 [Ruminococcus sp.]|nr:hypothetical protein [Ruminococcus sp.]
MKIAYAGFDLFYPMLESLYQNGCEIVKIFSCEVDGVFEFNTKVTQFAQNHNIPITYEKITLSDLEELKANGVEALFCAAYYYRMPILKGFKMINVHPSLLPKGRGAWPMPLSILRNDKESGVTFHKMEEQFDTGEILMQKSFELDKTENLNTFMEKIYALLPNMVKDLLQNFDYYYDNAYAQGEGEYETAPDERNYIITKDTEFEYADRILRAFYGFHTIYNDGENEHILLNCTAVKGENFDEQFKIQGGYIECNKKG